MKPNRKLGEGLGQAGAHQPEEGADVEDTVLVEKVAGAVGVGQHVHQMGIAVGLVQPDAQVQLRSFLVEREEVRVIHAAGTLYRPHEDAAGTVLLGEAQLVQGVRHAEKRQHAHPAQPPLGFLPDVRHPAVVGAAKGHVHFRTLGALVQEDARVEDLHVDAQLVHVRQPRPHVGHVPGCHAGGHLPADPLRTLDQRLLGERKPEQPADLPVDDPVLPLRPVVGIEKSRPVLLLRGREIIPSTRALDYVRVSVYPSHWTVLLPWMRVKYASEISRVGARQSTGFVALLPPAGRGVAAAVLEA